MGRGTCDALPPRLRIAQGHHLRVWPACPLGMALAEDTTIGRGEYAADAGVGVGEAKRLLRQHQTASHVIDDPTHRFQHSCAVKGVVTAVVVPCERVPALLRLKMAQRSLA